MSIDIVYCNKVDELTVFPSLKAAQDWLTNNQLDTSGTSILVSFKDEYDTVHFLKPSNFVQTKISDDESNKDIRIMGAANRSHTHGIIEWVKNQFTSEHIPHLNNLEGNIISLVDQGFIIIYEKGEQSVGSKFANFFNKEKQTLINAINAAQTNEGPHINQAEFLEKLSQLVLDLDIKGGMTYFVTKDKEGNQHIYRQTFKEDPTNKNIEKYLREEAKWHESKRIKIKEHKSPNHHIIRFLIDWCKWTVFAAISAIGAGLILGIFVAAPLGTVAAAIAAVVTFIGLSSYGFYKADQNNPTTIEFGTPEFMTESEVTFSSRIRQKLTILKDFFARRLNKTADLSAEQDAGMNSVRDEYASRGDGRCVGDNNTTASVRGDRLSFLSRLLCVPIKDGVVPNEDNSLTSVRAELKR